MHAQSAAQPATNPANGHQTVLSETDQYRMSAPVVKIGALLGMKPETAANVFTLFNIVILFGGIGYGLLKVLPKTFRNRSTAIQKHLVDARTATEEATARLSSVEDRLSKLDDQIAAMRAQAEADSARDEQRILASVEDEKNKILAAADAEIQSATVARTPRDSEVCGRVGHRAGGPQTYRHRGDGSFAGGEFCSQAWRREQQLMAAVDLRYARALAAVVSDQKLDVVATQGQLNDFVDTLEASAELREVLENPSIPEPQKLKVLDAIAAKSGMSKTVRNFIAVIADHQRLHELRSMVAAYGTIADENASVAEAEIVSAMPLDENNRKLLEQKIQTLTGQQHVHATYSEDATLLGGAVVTIGSTVYDGSIRAQLQQLKARLIAAGA